MDFGAKVRTEIVRMGVETVRKAYLVMDGSIGLRNIHEERFRGLVAAELDSYHASQHLHAFADAFPGADRGTWLRTLLDGLKKDGFSPLDAALAAAESAIPPPRLPPPPSSAKSSASGNTAATWPTTRRRREACPSAAARWNRSTRGSRTASSDEARSELPLVSALSSRPMSGTPAAHCVVSTARSPDNHPSPLQTIQMLPFCTKVRFAV